MMFLLMVLYTCIALNHFVISDCKNLKTFENSFQDTLTHIWRPMGQLPVEIETASPWYL